MAYQNLDYAYERIFVNILNTAFDNNQTKALMRCLDIVKGLSGGGGDLTLSAIQQALFDELPHGEGTVLGVNEGNLEFITPP